MAILIFLLWVIMNGRITPEIVLFGLALSVVISLFLYKILNHPIATDLRILRNFPVFLLYILNLIREVAVAAFTVIRIVWNPGKHPEPVLVEFHSGLEGRLLNVLLANSITLTPGTYTVYLKEDHFIVHCLREEFAEGITDTSFARILRRVK